MSKTASIIFDDKTYEKIKREGNKKERSVSAQIRFIVANWFVAKQEIEKHEK